MYHPELNMTYDSPRWSYESTDCSLPLTLDTYNNCSFGCKYCFSQYQRGIGTSADDYLNKKIKSINPEKIRRIFTDPNHNPFWEWVKNKRPIQYGGLSDQFDGFERKYGVTYEVLSFLKELNYPICFSTKSTWPFYDDKYRDLFRGQDNWNMKFSIITHNADVAKKIEVGVPSPQDRINAMREYVGLNNGGVTLRLRPFIIGISSRDYLDLIEAAHDAGASALSTEFLCVDTRMPKQAKGNFSVINDLCGFDIVDFYKKYSSMSGYLRLNRKVKRPYIEKMQSLCDKLGMRFYVSDAHFKELSCGSCCCGLDTSWNYSRGNFSNALQIAKNNGIVHWSDISSDMEHFGENTIFCHNAFNLGSREHSSIYYRMTIKEYLHCMWNDVEHDLSPYKLFGFILKPDGFDDNGDVIYRYDG